MKPACLILVLLVFVTGGQGDGGYNEACSAGDSCDDLSLYCDTTDANDKKCKCNYGYFAKNSKCVPGAGHPCHHSNCYFTLNCINGQCLCDSVTIGYEAASNGSTSCSCASNKVLQDNVCKLKLDEEGCTTADDCAGDNGVECTGSPLACGCTAADGYQANTAKTECECKSTHHANSDGVCKLKLDEEGCTTADDCTGDNGVECTGSPLACGCTAADGYQVNTTKTECECKSTHHANSDGVCKLKLGQANCSTADDCTGDNGVECTGSPKTCGCSDVDGYQANGDNTTCECKSDYVMEDDACLLRVGKHCNSSTRSCAHGMLCDRTTSTCLCNTVNGYAEGNEGEGSCSCDTSVAQTMTYGGKTYCGKKVGGTCTLQSDSDVCYGSTCKSSSQTVSGNTIVVYGCACADGETAGDDGTCSGAGHTAVSMALCIVGIMSALF